MSQLIHVGFSQVFTLFSTAYFRLWGISWIFLNTHFENMWVDNELS